jgi:rhodanese-related sulfurtransferase
MPDPHRSGRIADLPAPAAARSPGPSRITGLGRAAVAGVATLALAALAGCSNRTTDRDVELLGVADAREAVVGGRTLLGEDRTGAWIDPRTVGDWLAERIPGALHVPVGEMRDRAPELRGYDVLVVYGRGFKDPVAIAGAKVLRDAGIGEVRVLEGGLTAWRDAGLPVASGSPAPDEGLD